MVVISIKKRIEDIANGAYIEIKLVNENMDKIGECGISKPYWQIFKRKDIKQEDKRYILEERNGMYIVINTYEFYDVQKTKQTEGEKKIPPPDKVEKFQEPADEYIVS